MSDLETLIPPGVLITVAGETLTLKPLKVGSLPAFLRAISPVMQSLTAPAIDWLALPENEAGERIPYLLAVDGNDVLHRVIVDARMMQATRRCLLLWHRLQEHGGINDSHAQRLLVQPAGIAPI